MKISTLSLLSALLFAFAFSFTSKASHLMGGEITWKCLGNGQYIFQMKVYRDCNGIPFGPPVSLDVHNNPNLTTIPLNLISQNDISGFTTCVTCGGATGTTQGAVEEFIFESNPITLTGTPPAQGWGFSWGSCCRNASISNIVNASSLGFTLRAFMFPVNGQPADSCYDSSPAFAERPATTTGVGYDFHYTPFATDAELDSLVYTWDVPLDQWAGGAWSSTNPQPISYAPGFSASNPFPAATTLNPSTGEITFNSPAVGGVFVSVNKVTAYKCGAISAEIYRDMQFGIIPGNVLPGTSTLNSPPIIVPPFVNNTTFDTTVYAGDLVNFPIDVFDTNIVNMTTYQDITIEVAGNEFGGGFTDTAAGCLIPPCATLSMAPPITATFYAATIFNWQTTNDHLGMNYYCAYMPNTYYFLVRAKDNFCPVHAFTVAVVKITVLPTLPKPVITQNNDSLQTPYTTGYDYQWYLDRFIIPGATANAYKPTAIGEYQLRVIESVTNSGNYSDSFEPVFTGINSIENNSSPVTIAPNPSKGKFVLSGFNASNFDLTVADRLGKTVYQKTFSNYNSSTLSVELENVEDGIYFLQLRSDLKSYQAKVVIKQ